MKFFSGESKDIKNSWIYGNYIYEFELDWEIVKELPIRASIRPPIIKNLPIDFEFTTNGERIANKFSKFTFLGGMYTLLGTLYQYIFFNGKPVSLYAFN